VIALIDYGAGNLTSVKKALTALQADFTVPSSVEACAQASGIIVPGVGHFAATAALEGQWLQSIGAAVADGVPLLGICLGMQWLFEGSTEAPGCPGLGVLEGRCARLEDRAGTLKIPHVGWNALSLLRPSALLDGVNTASYVYFTHSFAAPVTDAACAVSAHGDTFAAAVERGHVGGVQFHPEKSGDAGLRILRNFVALCGRFGADRRN